jgi:hypothetical protein
MALLRSSNVPAAPVGPGPTAAGMRAQFHFWKNYEAHACNPVLSAPADALAFKIVRDMFLCPSTGLGADTAALVSEVFARIPQAPPADACTMPFVARGQEPAFSEAERLAAASMWTYVDDTFDRKLLHRRREIKAEFVGNHSAVMNDSLYRQLVGLPDVLTALRQDEEEAATVLPGGVPVRPGL